MIKFNLMVRNKANIIVKDKENAYKQFSLKNGKNQSPRDQLTQNDSKDSSRKNSSRKESYEEVKEEVKGNSDQHV